ncbi:hypothetical protein M9458_003874, partial [Cirrhinus mrigala]
PWPVLETDPTHQPQAFLIHPIPPSSPNKLLPPISEQITKHLQQQMQQHQQSQPSSHVSGQRKSRENISQQLRQHRAGQKAGQEPRGRKPNPVITKAVSSENLPSASNLKLSPCRSLEVGDELVPQIAINQECLISDKGSILSRSAPESSLREVMGKGQRSNSVPHKNLLMVPQWEWAVPLATYGSDDLFSANRSSSALDLQNFNRPIWRSRSCERETVWFANTKSHKHSNNMAAPLRSRKPSLLKIAIPSPNISPLGSPLSPSNMMTIRPFVN